jgi:glycosyltransferase involved in cell wall biosynthesis
VIHNAVFPLGRGDKQDIVLFLGRLTIQKGPEFFLKAAKKILDHSDIKPKFVVAGIGDMLPQLINQSIVMGISQHVMFTGLLSEEEVEHIYRIANVYVMPSVSEPFGITALEALSAGTPVIVSKSAGVAEALTNCLRVDFWDVDEMANKIISLLKYDVLHSTLSEHGERECGLFTWDRVADQTIQVYNGVL